MPFRSIPVSRSRTSRSASASGALAARGSGRARPRAREIGLGECTLGLACIACLLVFLPVSVIEPQASIAAMSAYDRIARLYDPWSVSVVEDVPFYLERARRSGGPVVELGVGTGRIAIPIAADGIQVIGVDSSEGMLEVARERAAARRASRSTSASATSATRRSRARCRSCSIPFRSLLHMQTDDGPAAAVRARCTGCSSRTGRFVFDVFSPGAEDIAETHGRWLEREPGIFERADWDERTPHARSSASAATASSRSSRSRGSRSREWRELLGAEGFVVEGLYGWFDGTPVGGPRGRDLGLPQT